MIVLFPLAVIVAVVAVSVYCLSGSDGQLTERKADIFTRAILFGGVALIVGAYVTGNLG
jgi:hypothetical protein